MSYVKAEDVLPKHLVEEIQKFVDGKLLYIPRKGENSFSWCGNLKNFRIPESVISIGYEAFACCESLQQITVPKSVKHIGKNAFCWQATLHRQPFFDCGPVSRGGCLTIRCEKRSYAHKYAKKNKIPFQLV